VIVGEKMKLLGTFFAIFFAISIINTSEAEASRKKRTAANKADAQAHCKKLRSTGITCKEGKRSCGRGWKSIKKFDRRRSTSWHACVRTNRGAASDNNKKQAEEYCKKLQASGTQCKVGKRSCGRGWDRAKSFKGKGTNYHACVVSKRAKGTESNKAQAEAYCEKIRKSGQKCKVGKRSCGIGWKRAKSFKGKGTNFHACVETNRKAASNANKDEAQKYCDELNKVAGKFLHCQVDKGNRCGTKGKALKKFKGKGRNSVACVKAK
jgi:hypothetical protein